VRTGRASLLPALHDPAADDQSDGKEPAREIELHDTQDEHDEQSDHHDGAHSGESHGVLHSPG
jgi:hypothetical protein